MKAEPLIDLRKSRAGVISSKREKSITVIIKPKNLG